jgi:hypothetical protein
MDDEPAIHTTCAPDCRYSFTAHDYRRGRKQCPGCRWRALQNRLGHSWSYCDWPALLWRALTDQRL